MSQLTEQQRERLLRQMNATCEACNLIAHLTLALIHSSDSSGMQNALLHFLRQMNVIFPEGTNQAIDETNAPARELGIDFMAFSLGDIDHKGTVN